ncbi:PepSY domain-containing protein [Phenylobacterium koreense]|uniref:PepSY domain-containing protein n=1 Tax=Phenylobacterium koreense TaxID=266125 RepID=A0ABV2ENQ8_9CAUL
MRRVLILLALGAGLAAGGVALAGDHCDRPMRDWRPREAVEARAGKLGVEVHRIRTDDGCYKIYGRAGDGRRVEIEMDPVTLKVLETEYGDQERHEEGRGHHEGRRATPPAPSRSVPTNPLIGPATAVTK